MHGYISNYQQTKVDIPYSYNYIALMNRSLYPPDRESKLIPQIYTFFLIHNNFIHNIFF